MSDPRFDPKELRRLIREGRPFEDIFPRMPNVTPAPEDKGLPMGSAEFVAQTMVSPHDGSPMRSYILACHHASTTLSLMDMAPDRDGEVLGNMLLTLRRRVADGGGMCLCEPVGWSRA